MNTLESDHLNAQVLTLQEAISTVEMNQEGSVFLLKLKDLEGGKSKERVIRLRCSEVFFDGEKRIIL
jgi:hypothetical protein